MGRWIRWPSHPRIRVLGVAGLGLVVYAYGSTSEVAWLFLIAYWIWLMGLASLVYSSWNVRGLNGEIGISGFSSSPESPAAGLPDSLLRTAAAPGPIFEGDTVRVELRINNSGTARGPAYLSGLAAGHAIGGGTGIVPAGGWECEVSLGTAARGPVLMEDWMLEASDPLGLFPWRRWAPEGELAIILPRFASLRDLERTHEMEAAVTAPRSGSGSELYGVREYRSGDPLRRIHWRSSARRGDLVVREYEPPGLRTLGVFLDPKPVTPAIADQMARIAASEVWDCVRAGGQVVLWSPGRPASDPRHGRSFWDLLEWIARHPGGAGDAAVAAPAPRVYEAVAIGDSLAALAGSLDEVRRRGGEGRAWLVGSGSEPALDVPVRRVGEAWPL